jgi:hypothetical protein
MWTDPTWTEPNERGLIVPNVSGPAGRLLFDLRTRQWGRYELLGLMPHDPPSRRSGPSTGEQPHDEANAMEEQDITGLLGELAEYSQLLDASVEDRNPQLLGSVAARLREAVSPVYEALDKGPNAWRNASGGLGSP